MSEASMQIYIRKPETVRAVQWNKPGDHPGVEAEHETGLYHLIDETGETIDEVEATDYIVETATGGLRVIPADLFLADYQPAPAAQHQGAAEGDAAKPRSRGPSREWLERAGEIEDATRSVSVGGLAVDAGMYEGHERPGDDLARAIDLMRTVADERRGLLSVSAMRDGITHGVTINSDSLRALLAAAVARPKVGEATRRIMETFAQVARFGDSPLVNISIDCGMSARLVTAVLRETVEAALDECEVPR